MEGKYFYILFLTCTSLLNFVTSFGQYQYISDCSFKYYLIFLEPSFFGLTFICGETDNISQMFTAVDSVYCPKSEKGNDYAYNEFGTMSFENCKFDDISSGYFKNFTNLRVFDVSNVGTKTISIEKCHHLPYLIYFNASHNQLTSFPPNLFKVMENLRTLDLSYNAIKCIDLSDFEGAGNLTMLNISNNGLVEIPSYLFRNASQLNKVDFSSNAIEQVQATAFVNLNDLTSLNLANNRLKSLETHLFDNMPKLAYLNLSYNPIGDLKIDTFVYLTELEHLDLRRTNISNIVLGTFSFQPKLISLDLSENNLKSLDFDLFLPGLKNLESLRLGDNQLRNLNGLENRLFPQLTSLDIKNNKFDCQYLIEFIKSLDWKNIDIPLNPNAIDRQTTTIRGINCKNYGSTGESDDYQGENRGSSTNRFVFTQEPPTPIQKFLF